MDLYDKYAENWNEVYRVERGTWNLLELCIKKHHVKTCVEFGCGLSTILMDAIGVRVTAFEDKSEYIHPLFEHLNQSAVVLYDDIFDLKIDSSYDMAFIDGPQKGMMREPSYWHVAKARIPLVVCHDIWRSQENRFLHRYFDGTQIDGFCRRKQDNALWTIALKIRK